MPRTSFAMSRYVFFLDALDRRILHEGLESAHVEGELVTLRNEKIDLGDLLLEGNQDRAAPGDEGDEKPVLLAELLRHLALHDLGLATERLGKERAGDPRPDQDEGQAGRKPDEKHQGITPGLHRLSPWVDGADRASGFGRSLPPRTSCSSRFRASAVRSRTESVVEVSVWIWCCRSPTPPVRLYAAMAMTSATTAMSSARMAMIPLLWFWETSRLGA